MPEVRKERVLRTCSVRGIEGVFGLERHNDKRSQVRPKRPDGSFGDLLVVETSMIHSISEHKDRFSGFSIAELEELKNGLGHSSDLGQEVYSGTVSRLNQEIDDSLAFRIMKREEEQRH